MKDDEDEDEVDGVAEEAARANDRWTVDRISARCDETAAIDVIRYDRLIVRSYMMVNVCCCNRDGVVWGWDGMDRDLS